MARRRKNKKISSRNKFNKPYQSYLLLLSKLERNNYTSIKDMMQLEDLEKIISNKIIKK